MSAIPPPGLMRRTAEYSGTTATARPARILLAWLPPTRHPRSPTPLARISPTSRRTCSSSPTWATATSRSPLRAPTASSTVVADARPNTAVAPFASIARRPHAQARRRARGVRGARVGEPVADGRRRVARGISYSTAAWPIGKPEPYAVVVRDLAEQVLESSGAMENAFMDVAEELLDSLSDGPLTDVRTGEPFATVRTAGDGVMRVSASGQIAYASPNAVNIMRLAGVDSSLPGLQASIAAGRRLRHLAGARDARRASRSTPRSPSACSATARSGCRRARSCSSRT